MDNINAMANFDWNAYKSEPVDTSVCKEELQKRFDAILNKNKLEKGMVSDGVIIAISKKRIVVNLGWKSDAIIPIPEYRGSFSLIKIGNVIPLKIIWTNPLRVSAWLYIIYAHQKDVIIEGIVEDRSENDDGFVINVLDQLVFLPDSLSLNMVDQDDVINTIVNIRIVKIDSDKEEAIASCIDGQDVDEIASSYLGNWDITKELLNKYDYTDSYDAFEPEECEEVSSKNFYCPDCGNIMEDLCSYMFCPVCHQKLYRRYHY